MRRSGWAGAGVAVGLLFVTGCGGGGGNGSAPAVDPALAKAVNKNCGHFLKPESVAAALGDNTFDGTLGKIQGDKGSCSITVSVREAGRGTSGPRHSDVKLSLEILSWKDPALVAQSVDEVCHNTSAVAVTEIFQGPKGACSVWRAEPTEEFLVGGKLDVHGGEGTKRITITVHGVDGTLKQDREHALQLLADVRAEISRRA
ncbi:hypothetical protein [Streptomyces sp. NPDC014733]|uniref:hypothetical protein n=1 Tax=Streptomyces sp. NPDC014733 TaxID=3364885 RepID=UPI003701D74D